MFLIKKRIFNRLLFCMSIFDGFLSDDQARLPAIKMGDSPSVGRLLRGAPEDPSQPSWGGRFVRAADRPKFRFQRLTTPADPVDTFAVAEFAIPAPAGLPPNPQAQALLDNRVPSHIAFHDGKLHFRFCPKEARVWSYIIESKLPALNGMTGKFTARPLSTAPHTPSPRHPNWWVDDPDSTLTEGIHQGAKSLSQWRQQFLEDFAKRIERTSPKR